MDASVSISTVTVSIDGAIYTQATYGGNRQDACDANGNYPGCPNVGYSFTVDTTQLVSGVHTLVATATTSDNRQTGQTVTFYTSNGSSSVVNIDASSAQGTYSGWQGFGGWVVDGSAQVSSVAIQIDGAVYGEATYGGNRQDVCNALGNYPGCPNVGWNFGIDTTQLTNGQHSITVTSTTSDGRQTSQSGAFYTSNGGVSLVDIDAPNVYQVYSGTLNFGGWSMNGSTTISNVSVIIDGTSYSGATYGNNRQDACDANGNYPGCPNVGWSLGMATNGLADGMHWISVTATAANSAQTASMTRFFTNNGGNGGTGGSCPSN